MNRSAFPADSRGANRAWITKVTAPLQSAKRQSIKSQWPSRQVAELFSIYMYRSARRRAARATMTQPVGKLVAVPHLVTAYI